MGITSFQDRPWDVHVDYVTATTYGDPRAGDSELLRRVVQSVTQRYAPVEEVLPRSLLGYSGAGSSIAFLGARGDGWLTRCSGAGAHEFARHLATDTWRASRLDIALDIFVGFDPDPIITAAFEIACDVRDAVTFGFKRKVRLIDSGGDGNTLYLGARTSQVFCRMYNKGRESGEDRYSGVLRAEVQFNGATAGTALKSLAACGYRASAMCATVLAAFGKAGVELQAGEQGEGPIGWSVEAPSPDVVKQVRWLREQVGPTARRVEQVYGRGSVASLLGLNDDA